MQGSKDEIKGLLGNNRRPLQQAHHRTVRTNINFPDAGQVRAERERERGREKVRERREEGEIESQRTGDSRPVACV